MVDEGDSTQATLGAMIERVYGVKVVFQGGSRELLAGTKLEEIAEVSVLSFLSPRCYLVVLSDWLTTTSRR
jgi:hypothetical protein